MVVILLFVIVWCFGSGFFVGTCPFGWTRFLGSTDFLILFVMAAPGHGPIRALVTKCSAYWVFLGTLLMTRWDRPGLLGLL